MARQSPANVETRFSALAADFDRCVGAFAERGPFSGRQLALHRETIALRHQLGSAAAAAESSEFANALYDTLRGWGIGVRSSKLIPRAEFESSLRRHTRAIDALDGRRIDDEGLPTSDVTDELWTLIMRMPIVENHAKLVAATKTLHHLLPELVPPMDREWTGRFLGLHPPQWQPVGKQEWIFKTTLLGLARVARAVRPARYVGDGWQSSPTKVLDNALVGYCMLHLPRAAPPARGHAAPRMVGPRRYEALTRWLRGPREAAVSARFGDVEEALGRPLPASARRYRAWWANHLGNSQARGWLAAGRRVAAVDLDSESVTFA